MWPFGRREPPAADPVLGGIAAGGGRFERLVFTRNRRVMASSAEGGRTLRLHESFRDAPAEVLRAVGELFTTRSAARRSAARAILREYVAARVGGAPAPPRRPARPRAEDVPHLRQLRAEFGAVNAAHFGGVLPDVPIRLSGRMRRRNGHFSTEPLEIAISRALCARGAPGEAERTLRHEMIHLWQWHQGRKPDHGGEFRRWERKLDSHPRATRAVCWIDDSD